MAKILLSLPDDVLQKIDDYRKKRGLKRNKFFLDAVDRYFLLENRKNYFLKRKGAVISIKNTGERLKKIRDWDPVGELRKSRDTRANRLLKNWEND
jgi:metal-responsive CopG/Arc/MetJ family transcriptional regulator